MVTGFAFAVLVGAVGVGAYSQSEDAATVAVRDTDPGQLSDGTAPDTQAPVASTRPPTDPSTSTPVAPSTVVPSTVVPGTVMPSTIAPSTIVGTTVAAPTTTIPTSACPAVDGSSIQVPAFAAAPPVCTDEKATYTAEMETSEGAITIALDSKNAPKTVNNFVFLSRYHFYDGLTIHRVVPGFIFQGGDPLANSNGGPGYKFPDELPGKDGYDVGAVAMANSGVNSNGSQFFIVTGSTGQALRGTYSTFGKVTRGLNVLKAIDALGRTPGPNAEEFPPRKTITIVSVTITAAGERESRIPGYATTTSVGTTSTTAG